MIANSNTLIVPILLLTWAVVKDRMEKAGCVLVSVNGGTWLGGFKVVISRRGGEVEGWAEYFKFMAEVLLHMFHHWGMGGPLIQPVEKHV